MILQNIDRDLEKYCGKVLVNSARSQNDDLLMCFDRFDTDLPDKSLAT